MIDSSMIVTQVRWGLKTAANGGRRKCVSLLEQWPSTVVCVAQLPDVPELVESQATAR